jgi:hypothetical protein
MFGMSLADICGSIAMALTSLPMPSYMPKEEIFGYKWAGTRLGNTYTCNAQGFFSTFGMAAVLCFDVMLCVYYACAIAFGMKEKKIKKYVEPIIHGLPIVFGLGFALPPLFLELYNPTTTFFPWCGFWVYPSECLNYDELECVRGDRGIMVVALYLFFVAVPFNFLIIVVSLVSVVIKVIKTERTLNVITTAFRDNSNNEILEMRLNNGRTKAVLVQSISYISSFLLAFALPMLNALDYLLSIGNNSHNNGFVGGAQAGIDRVTLFLFPLQGFFNFIIFVSFKVYNFRRLSKEDSIWSIFLRLFTSSDHDPAFITRISMVKISEKDGQDRSSFHVEITDEMMDENCRFRIGLMLTNISSGAATGDVMESQDALVDASSSISKTIDDVTAIRLRALLGSDLPKIDEDASLSNFESLESVQFGSNNDSGYHYYGTCIENNEAQT